MPPTPELKLRSDFAIISEIIEPRARVLDLGCGEAELLAWLVENKNVQARGVEIEPAKLRKAIARGVPAYQGDIDEGLTDYPDQAFDYVILSQTLQEVRAPLRVLREMLRVGRKAIILLPEFRPLGRPPFNAVSPGQSPRTKLFPYEWYESPNIHFLTVNDFEQLVTAQHFHVERRYFLAGSERIETLPNLMAEVAVFLVGRP